MNRSRSSTLGTLHREVTALHLHAAACTASGGCAETDRLGVTDVDYRRADALLDALADLPSLLARRVDGPDGEPDDDVIGVQEMPLGRLRALANGRVLDPVTQHAVDVDLLRRELATAAATYAARMFTATPQLIRSEQARWACLPGRTAGVFRQILAAAEERLQPPAPAQHDLVAGDVR